MLVMIFMLVGGALFGNFFCAALNAGVHGAGGGWQTAHQCKHCKHIGDHWSYVRPCRSCGESTDNVDSAIVAELVWAGDWYNPFSWYNLEWKIKEKKHA